MSDNRGNKTNMGSMQETSDRAEPVQVRRLLDMPPEGSTEDVLRAINSLQLQCDQMTQMWQALTDLLYLGPETPPSEVLGNVNAYIREAEFLRSQEQRHLYVIQKLQRDKTEILKRFHLNKPKTPSAVKIRSKSRFTGTLDGEKENSFESTDLGIIDDVTGSESLEDTHNSVWLKANSKSINDDQGKEAVPNKNLWEALNDPRYRNISKTVESERTFQKNLITKDHATGVTKKVSQKSLPEAKHGPRGFILPTINPKKTEGVRSNITPGTRESMLHSRAKTLQEKAASNHQVAAVTMDDNHSTHNGMLSHVAADRESMSSSKILKPHVNAASNRKNARHDISVVTNMEVTDEGGCFDIPELGVRLSIPSGALSKGKATQTLTVTLSWGEMIPAPLGLKCPIGPTIDIKPNGIPFEKPLVLSLPHNVTCHGREERSHLILMQQTVGNDWVPVDNDSPTAATSPLGFIAPETVIVQMKSSGKYALVPAARANFCPQALRVLGLARYDCSKEAGCSTLQIDIYCTEDSRLTHKLYEILADKMREQNPPKYFVFEQSLSLSGELPVQVCVKDMMEGWQVLGEPGQMFDPSDPGPGLRPVVTLTLEHTLQQLRCLLAKLTFTQDQGEGHSECPYDSISLGVDLDQFVKLGLSGATKSSGSMAKDTNMIRAPVAESAVCSPRRSGTFLTDYQEDGTRQNSGREEGSIKVKVKSARNVSCWIPDHVKSELVEEIKEDMPGLDKWFDLIMTLDMGMFTEVLNQSSEPVHDLLCYCEVTGVSVVKVKDILQSMRFDEASRVLTRYLKEHPLECE